MRRQLTEDFLHTTLGSKGQKIHRLGLSASHWPGKKTIYRALDEGLNFFFFFRIDRQMIAVLKDVFRQGRDNFAVATGAFNVRLGRPNLRRVLERRLRQLKTDCLDIFLFLAVMKPEHFRDDVKEDLLRLKEEGKIKAVGISTHDRLLAGELAKERALDVLMIRYNAAHRGAEQDIFPFLHERRPVIVSYTATRWGHLIERPRDWPKDGSVPTAGLCYRYVLSNPHIHVCLTAPSTLEQFDSNLTEIRKGPLSEEEMTFMNDFGSAVYRAKKWFM
jgi:aryl-alcohol dehydrogenase-like predicted oxidoreductase